MNDKMTPIPFKELMNWILSEKGSIFGVRRRFKAKDQHSLPLFEEKMEVPVGPAAGPHTQLSQNIIAAYVAGARFFELKTVQTLDGEDLPVDKPCIYANDECYNVEWSTELTVGDAFNEYAKAWFALKLLSKELELGDENGFMFNMSVGYDLEGIKSPKIDDFIEHLKDASNTPIWAECKAWALENLQLFTKIDETYIQNLSAKISNSITLSTLHGCPPAEIERIPNHLILEKKLNTYIKCNPTLLGYEFARNLMNTMGYDYLVFDDHHFNNDLQFSDAVPMLQRLQALADTNKLAFGVKLSNTFPVKIASKELPGEEMYMSGRSLFPLTISLAVRLARAFEGRLRISFSGGADNFNIEDLFATGIYPITLATTLLKPGGYQRLTQLADKLSACDYPTCDGINLEALQTLANTAISSKLYLKPIKPLPTRKRSETVPLTDCSFAPCSNGCPIHQDIPEYIRLCGEGNYLEALKVIVDKNPLPFITGTICSHRCMDKCRRNFYEESIAIRDVKLLAATQAFDTLIGTLETPEILCKEKVAIVGGGVAGLSAAYFLARKGMDVTLFEKRDSLGGIVRHIIPSFRIDASAIDKDIRLVEKYGVKFKLGEEISSFEALKEKGYTYIIVTVGATSPGKLALKQGEVMNVLDFLDQFKTNQANLSLGKNVIIIGGGNTAMDAARAAKRLAGVENVALVYRRNKKYMPADLEELSLALKDGVDFKELLAPLSLEDNKLICEKMQLGEPDASGRRSPVPTGEYVTLPADTVIAAVGETVEGKLFEANNLALDAKGKLIFNKTTGEVAPNLFIAGDVLSGPATVVEAIRDARNVADEILLREHLTEASQETLACSQCAASCDTKLAPIYAKKGNLTLLAQVDQEAARCLECDKVCECCVDVCPNRANLALCIAGKTQIVHIDRMCNECGNCTVFCPYDSSPYKEKFTLFHTLEEFNTSHNSGFFLIDADKKLIKLRLSEIVSETTLDTLEDNLEIKALIEGILKEKRLWLNSL